MVQAYDPSMVGPTLIANLWWCMVLSCVAAKSEKKKRKRKKLKKSSDAYDYDDLEGNPAAEPAKASKQPVCIINLKAKTFVHRKFL